jgi:hypothetical protein
MKVILGLAPDGGDDHTTEQYDIENCCGGFDASPIDDDGLNAESCLVNGGEE